MSMYGGDNIRSNSVLFKERRNFDKRWPKCLCYWERELSCWNPSEIVTVLVHQGQCSDGFKLMYFLRAVWEAPCQRLFANAGRTNVCVCVCNWAAVCVFRRIRNIQGECCNLLWSWWEAYHHIKALFYVWVGSSYFSFYWIWGGLWVE